MTSYFTNLQLIPTTNPDPTTRELPRFSSATTIGSLSTNTSFQTCAADDSYDGDCSNFDAKEKDETNDVLQNVNVLSDIDSIADILSSMGIQSPKQVNIVDLLINNNDGYFMYIGNKNFNTIIYFCTSHVLGFQNQLIGRSYNHITLLNKSSITQGVEICQRK